MKKILSLCLAALMIFSVLPAAFAAEEVETIANIEETSEYAEAIKFLNTLDVYTGMENGDLAADEPVQRWQMANFLYRIATGDVDHSDVKTTTNYTPFKGINIGDFDGSCAENLGAISWAYQAKVVNGYSATEYGPTDEIIYQDAITMIVRLLGERYTAASYPYGFVTTARELGITDGITGIGLEDEIDRGVVAQLLYNAIFAPVYNEKTEKNETLAGNVFNVGKATVMITATNEQVYIAGESPVLRTDKVRFAPVNTQLVPMHNGYHVDAELFGLEDIKAANAAVGTLYEVYYEGDMENILSAESLTEVYWNLGHDAISVEITKTPKTIASTSYYYYINIDDAAYEVVTSYTNLKKNQYETSDPSGSEEMKLFKDYGVTSRDFSNDYSKYIIKSDGHVYDIANPDVPYLCYSSALDLYYQVKVAADGTTSWDIWSQAKVDALMKEVGDGAATYGFTSFTKTSVAPYAKVTVTGDAIANIREYRFGQIAYDTAERKENGATVKNDTFTLTTGLDSGVATINSSNKLWTASTTEYVIKDYTWTNIQKADIPENSYIIYYVNHVTKEIDVLEIINGVDSDEDDSYTVKGYLRGFDLASSKLVLGDFGNVYTEYTYNYNAMLGATIRGYSSSDAANNAKLFNIMSALYDKYIELVIVDGKVVHIDFVGDSSDFVIIDTFVSFEEDGILVKGWNTLDEQYTTFKINALNGWTVSTSFDYFAYFFGGYGTGSNPIASLIPFDTYELYKVASYTTDADGNYVFNLTAAGNKLTHYGLKVNEYGIIEGVNDKGELGRDKYLPTANGQYWLVLDTKNDKVYSLNDKVNPVVQFTTGADLYKSKQDFVLVIDNDGEMIANDTFMGNNISFYIYNKVVNFYDNVDYLVGNNTFYYQQYMTNVLTGKIEAVQISNPALGLGNSYHANKMFNLTEGAIYKAVDGVIYTTKNAAGEEIVPTYTLENVADYYVANSSAFEDFAAIDGTAVVDSTVAGKTYDKVYDIITESMRQQLKPEMSPSLTSYFDASVSLYWVDASKKLNKVTLGTSSAAKTSQNAFNAYVADTSYVYNMYYIIDETSGKAYAWVVKTSTGVVLSGEAKKITAKSGMTGLASFTEGDGNDVSSSYASIEYSLDRVAKKVTITYTPAAGTLISDWVGQVNYIDIFNGTEKCSYNNVVFDGEYTYQGTGKYFTKVVVTLSYEGKAITKINLAVDKSGTSIPTFGNSRVEADF